MDEPKLSREEQKLRTRQRLIDAAADVFARRGYGPTTLDEIAERAGLTKGAVYSNFSGKTDLAIAVLDSRIDAPQLEIFDAVEADADEAQRFAQAGSLLGAGLDTGWFRLELECTVEALRDDESLRRLRQRDDSARRALVSALSSRTGDTDARPSSQEVDELARALVAVVNGAALERLKNPDAMPVSTIAALLEAVVTGFVQGASSGTKSAGAG
jgi:AcrR family transcriptional regulator